MEIIYNLYFPHRQHGDVPQLWIKNPESRSDVSWNATECQSMLSMCQIQNVRGRMSICEKLILPDATVCQQHSETMSGCGSLEDVCLFLHLSLSFRHIHRDTHICIYIYMYTYTHIWYIHTLVLSYTGIYYIEIYLRNTER